MGAIGVTGGRRSALVADWQVPDRRRILQLALATTWLLDSVLQFQPFMFTRAFGTQMIASMARGNPAGLAHQISWAGQAIGRHPEASNTVFALVQLFIALGIAWRPTVKLALAGSVVWALAVWWIGEGLGRVLTSQASTITGAPGAVILYAVLAVLLWPRDRDPSPAPFVAARSLGAPTARVVWFALWAGLAYWTLQGVDRSSQGLHNAIGAMAAGQPHWLASLDTSAARLVAHRGLEFSIVLAVVFLIVAVGTFLPTPAARATIVAAIALSTIIWVVGQDFGGVFSGSGTDPNSGPLLILLAAAFWPSPERTGVPAAPASVQVGG
ncbi:MAG TPA: hypothetical protein VN799_04860 [Acidimicrobiales bacterium]|nr:hypothetical protein [Acidimicrobiales bacterium]